MPKWIHDRAKSLQQEMEETYPPKKAKQVAFAVATQQAHAAGKAPKTWHGKPFGTSQGKREAKKKFDRPRSAYDKTAASQNSSSCATLETMQSGSNALARLFQPESGSEKMSKQASRREFAQKEKLSMVRSPREAKMIEARSVMEEILGVPNTAKRAQLEGLMGDMNAAPVAAMDPRLLAAAYGAPGAAMPGIVGAPAMGPAPAMAAGVPGQRVDTGPGFAGYGGDPAIVAHVGPGAMPTPAAGPTPGDFQAMAMPPAAQPTAAAKAPVKAPGPQNAAKTGSDKSQKLALSLDDLKGVLSDPRVIGGAGGAAVGGLGSALATRGMKNKRRRAAIIAGSTVAGGGAGAGIGHLLRGGPSGKGKVPAGIRRHFNPLTFKAMAYKSAAATPSAAGPSGMSVPMTPGAAPTTTPQAPMASRGSVTPAPTTPTAGVQDFRALLADVQERAFQEAKAKYAQAASSGPLYPYKGKLDEYRDRSISFAPAAAGALGGHIAGGSALRAMEEAAARGVELERSKAFAEGQKLIDAAKAANPPLKPSKAKLPTLERAAQTQSRRSAIQAAQEQAAKIVSESTGKGVPWYAKMTKGGPKVLGSVRAATRIAAPFAGLLAIKGLLGRGRSQAERMYDTPKYGQLGEFAASHPMATALGGAALGGLAPWAMKGISNQLGYEFDPKAVSGLGVAAGGLAGYYAAKRGQNKRIQEAMRKEREQREQENLYREMMAQQSPFGY